MEAVWESAAADGVDDFKLVAISQHAAGMLAARQDFPVQLHRDPAPRITGLFQQRGDGGGGGAVARVTVEHDVHARIVAFAVAGTEWQSCADKRKPARTRVFGRQGQ